MATTCTEYVPGSRQVGMSMSTRENKELVRQVYEEWNALNGDVAKLRPLYEKYYAPDYIHHDPSRGDGNLEQRIQYAVMWFTAFPDTT